MRDMTRKQFYKFSRSTRIVHKKAAATRTGGHLLSSKTLRLVARQELARINLNAE